MACLQQRTRENGTRTVSLAAAASRDHRPFWTSVSRADQEQEQPVSDAAYSPVVATDAILCTDGAAAYARFSTKNGMVHHVLNNKPGQTGIHKAFHIQNVNSLHSRQDEFRRPFKRPASKYLKLYLRWFLLNSRLSSEQAFRNVLEGIE
jgi:hypothetical protein